MDAQLIQLQIDAMSAQKALLLAQRSVQDRQIENQIAQLEAQLLKAQAG